MNAITASGQDAEATITLRALHASDESFLRGVYASTRIDELAPLAWEQAQVDAFIDMQFQAQCQHYWRHLDVSRFRIIVCDGIDAGRLYVERRECELRVVDIALLPAFRNRGIATRLLRQLFDEADQDGLVVSIHVEHSNPAQNLYSRLGFVLRGEAGEVYRLMERMPRDVAVA
ncbi:N-acetyltransferase [Dokdonella sp.]|uniref:GNAT family N-acetyltransferase n=1 Tax=Dokdonella sp. TaxID=2291710 RepID=UPI0025C526CF|nr:N-acetyltransferase [Dokdonella sp.]MBX3689353.1 GNAT family N-acetyltransferase [Dokdonella sp.]